MNNMLEHERAARQRFIYAHAKLTVWVRQTSDGLWEAMDWYGTVLCFGKYRAEVEREVKEMTHDFSKNIYAVATITEPKRRRRHYSKPTRRARC
jgi:23S rRNA G2069 N7-methylase RlmK/C1962 C5-methylase RlmI